MPFNQISLLQIGDIHFPDFKTGKNIFDLKDKGVRSDIFGATKLVAISKYILKLLKEDQSIKSIFLTGDLTSKGSLEGYIDCISYLRKTLNLDDVSYWKDRKIFISPGNHDIDRKMIIPGDHFDKKFKDLAAEWKRHAADIATISTDSMVSNLINLNNSFNVLGISVNTSQMCGEYRLFPAQVRDKIQNIIKDHSILLNEDERHMLLAEQIDCPAMTDDDIEAVFDLITNCNKSHVPIILGHHPLLPQSIPRIEGYNELLNAGKFREVLLETKKNVIYLHGHTHQNPIMTMSNTATGNNRIIHISAPLLEDGFNHIKILFSSKTNVPLGIQITPHRFTEHNTLRAGSITTLKLINEDEVWGELDNDLMEYMLIKLLKPSTIYRISDIGKNLPTTLQLKYENPEILNCTIVNSLLLFEILELITITNKSNATPSWTFRKKII